MSEHASEAAKKLAERLFSDDHARVRLYAESMIQRALDAAAAERDRVWAETLAPGVTPLQLDPEIHREALTFERESVNARIQAAAAEVIERAAQIAEKPSGHYQIGKTAVPYWSGVTIAEAIRAIAPQQAGAGTADQSHDAPGLFCWCGAVHVAPQQAEQPLVKIDTEGLKRMGLRVRIEAEQPDHAFEPGPWYEAERGDGDTITNRLCRVCKRSENAPTHRRAEGGSRG